MGKAEEVRNPMEDCRSLFQNFGCSAIDMKHVTVRHMLGCMMHMHRKHMAHTHAHTHTHTCTHTNMHTPSVATWHRLFAVS